MVDCLNQRINLLGWIKRILGNFWKILKKFYFLKERKKSIPRALLLHSTRTQMLKTVKIASKSSSILYLCLKPRKIESIIPSILKKVFPEITYESYQKLKKSKTLMAQVIPVCEECFLYHSRLNQYAGTESASKLMQVMGKRDYIGTGRLRPEAIRLRLEVTL